MAPKATRKSVSATSKPKRGKPASAPPAPHRQSSRVKKTQRPLKSKRRSTTKVSKKDEGSGDESNSDADIETQRPLKSKRSSTTKVPKKDKGSDGESNTDSDLEEQEAKPTESDAEDDKEPETYTVRFPQAREAGDTPYADDQIHPNTFLFLKELKANNNRDWLKWHDKIYRQALGDWESFVETLGQRLMSVDATVPELPKKDIIFRIYRDIRFSNDPTPYKPHFSAAWSRTGRKGPYAAYYVQIKPDGESFVGGGLWNPDGPALATIREDIDQNPARIRQALLNEHITKTFFHTPKGDEKAAIAAFTARNSENALKSKPKGFDANHKDITLLRLRNFTIGRKLSDAEVVAPTGIRKIADAFQGLVPWVTYLNSVVMPDPPSDNNSPDSDDSDQG